LTLYRSLSRVRRHLISRTSAELVTTQKGHEILSQDEEVDLVPLLQGSK